MAKIRQEINMLNATITATSVGFVPLTTTDYSGTVTYSFEIVGKVDSGTATITCQRNGTTTNDATVSLTATSYTRTRVTLTPPAGTTNYRIGISGGTNPLIRAARIIVLQDGTPISNTVTEIEIGAQETKTTTTVSPLNAPKYWYFDSAKWDDTTTFFIEICAKRDTSTMSSSTWVLQEDDGSFGTWTTKVTIASAVTSTTAALYSVAFTPVSGRNYRIASSDSDTMNGGHVIYNARILAYRYWSQVGNSIGVPTAGSPAIAALSSSRVAYIDDSGDQLRTYDFDGTNWSQVGNSLSISTVGSAALCALSSTRIAFIDNTNDQLRAYDFDGTNWSQVGNSLSISTVGDPALAGLSSTRVAFIDGANDQLRTYDFDGTNWSQVGNSLSISGTGNPALAGLSSTRIAFFDSFNDQLRTYDFDGTNWSQVGSYLLLPRSNPALAGLSSTRAVLAGVFSQVSLIAYDINGSVVKFEPQYLLINQSITTTGLQDFDTLFDPAEWSSVTNAYFHESNADGASSAVKLQTDPNGTPADITGSSVTGANRQRSSALTMPTSSSTIDANVTTA